MDPYLTEQEELEDALSPFATEAPGHRAEELEAEDESILGSPFLPAELTQPDPFSDGEDDTEAETWADPASEGEEEDEATAFEPEQEWESGDLEGEDEMDPAQEAEPGRWGGEVGLAEADTWAELEMPDEVFSQEEEAELEVEPEAEGSAGVALGLSSLAHHGAMHAGHGDRKGVWRDQVYGLVVHTSGGSLPGKARKAGMSAGEYAAQYYAKTGGTHYVIGWGGLEGQQLYQVMNERKVAWGVGVVKGKLQLNQWRSVDAGRFAADLPPIVLRLWRARWPGLAHSLELLPVRSSANLTYVHVECTPCVYYQNGDGRLITDTEYQPLRPGLRFTRAQHETVARLAWDIAQRNNWPAGQAWWRTARLVGHEDITPLSRHDKGGCWDPGALRDQPYFDWPYVYEALQRLSGTVSAPASQAGGGLLSGVTSTVGALLGDAADRFRSLVRSGSEVMAIASAVRAGQSDVNKLANLVFYARHPELNGRPIGRADKQLAGEWLQIRDTVVRPALARLAGSASGAAAPSAPTPSAVPSGSNTGGAGGDVPEGPFGTLTVAGPDPYRFSYRLTGEDASWIARLITGEAGGRNDPDSAAVIWAVFNRFALFAHSGSHWMTKAGYKGYPTLASFVQAYSTTLQPVLKSVGAAKRAIEAARKNPAKFNYVATGGVYQGTDVPRGQLQHHLNRIQQLRWSRLPQPTRDIVLAAFRGKLANPVGLASEFANTATYFRDANKRRPTQAEWREFTLRFAQTKKWTWQDLSTLRQFESNVFFVDNRVKALPADTVKVVM